MSQFSQTTVKVRKQHRCEWCPEPIAVGWSALCVKGKWDGELYTLYAHTECEAARVRWVDAYKVETGHQPANDEDECDMPERHSMKRGEIFPVDPRDARHEFEGGIGMQEWPGLVVAGNGEGGE